jgi:hypothetical protein
VTFCTDLKLVSTVLEVECASSRLQFSVPQPAIDSGLLEAVDGASIIIRALLVTDTIITLLSFGHSYLLQMVYVKYSM